MSYTTEEYLEDIGYSKLVVCCPSCGSPYESERDTATCPCLEQEVTDE